MSDEPKAAAAVPSPAPSPTKRRLRKVLPWVVILLCLLGGAFAYFRYSQSHKAPDVEYKVAAVERRRIVGRVTASGTLQAVVTVQVGTQVSGRVQFLYADFNSQVKKGELIAKIDPQLFLAAVAQAHANYDSAQAGVEQAQAKVADAQMTDDRAKRLMAQSLASQMDVQAADTALRVANANLEVSKASLEQSRAALNQSNVNLSYTSIVSPIDGVVISRNVDVGQTVAASLSAPVIFTIAEDLRKMQVNTNIAEGDVGRLKEDMEARFTVDAFPGLTFKGKISQIRNAAQTVQNVVTYDAVIDVVNDDLKLRPGMTANVTINYDTRDQALAVPNAALRFRPPPSLVASAPSSSGSAPPAVSSSGRGKKDDLDAKTVWVQDGARLRPVSVKIGLSDGTMTEVVSGELNEGDKVVTDATAAAGAATTTAAPGGTGMRRPF
jgi:HlyD family secretion protein